MLWHMKILKRCSQRKDTLAKVQNFQHALMAQSAQKKQKYKVDLSFYSTWDLQLWLIFAFAWTTYMIIPIWIYVHEIEGQILSRLDMFWILKVTHFYSDYKCNLIS